MAKKTTNKGNKGINLLKGITGSKLAKLATLVIILLAIPLTVLMSKQQQTTQQEATLSSCQKMGGSCINTDFQNTVTRCQASGKQILRGLCPGPANIQCCVKAVNCSNIGGTCADVNVNTCSGEWRSGYCPGGKNIRCCTNGKLKYVGKVSCQQYINPDNGKSGQCKTKANCSISTNNGVCSAGKVCCLY